MKLTTPDIVILAAAGFVAYMVVRQRRTVQSPVTPPMPSMGTTTPGGIPAWAVDINGLY